MILSRLTNVASQVTITPHPYDMQGTDLDDYRGELNSTVNDMHSLHESAKFHANQDYEEAQSQINFANKAERKWVYDDATGIIESKDATDVRPQE